VPADPVPLPSLEDVLDPLASAALVAGGETPTADASPTGEEPAAGPAPAAAAEVEPPAPSEPLPAVEVGPARSADAILVERPDVLGGFYREFYESGAYRHPADWTAKVGGQTAEDYARYWYDQHGKWEGGARSPEEAVDVVRLLHERPDVMAAYYEGFYEGGNDRQPGAWLSQVGGTQVEDYAKYWYDRHGKWEGYSQSPTGESLSAAQILADRPDVLRAFYVEFYETGAFRKPDQWLHRIGDKSPEAYARFWYDHHGQWEGYSQHAPAPVDAPAEPVEETPPAEGGEPVVTLAGESAADGLEPFA
jgi:hypothetical protein